MWSSRTASLQRVSNLLFALILGLIIFGDAFVNKDCVYLHHSSTSPSQILSSLLSTSTKLYANRQPAVQPFNPYSSRYRNSGLRWRDASGLGAFFNLHCNETLLTAKQEQQFGRAIQFWSRLENVRESLRQRFIGNLSTSAMISDELLAIYIGCSPEEIQQMRKYFEIAKRRLLLSNLKLVFSVVSRYRTSSLSNSEMILHGIVGLSQAVLRYDYSKGFRFATYATWYVHNAVSDYVRAQQTNVDYPNKPLSQLRKTKKYLEELQKTTDYTPTMGELAQTLKIPRPELRRVLFRRMTPVGFEQPMNGDNEKNRADEGENKHTIGSTVASYAPDPSDNIYASGILDYVETLLETELTPSEREVLKMRLGLDDGKPRPLKEAGSKSKVSWPKIQKLEELAWDKLQSLGLDTIDAIGNSMMVQHEAPLISANSV